MGSFQSNAAYYQPDSEALAKIQIIDVSKPLPDTDSTVRFSVTEEIVGRVMLYWGGPPVYTLEFLKPDGTRLRGTPELEVFDITDGGSVAIINSGGGPEIGKFYWLHYTRTYSVCYPGVPRKTISWRHEVEVS
ncbi:hypothetical protein PAXINDRAFT_98486 [Paxillus involutus ATCC 200175]|nr:hypothetical protein PAXINDRAFT_98486 [Paxillus involutus ATCC 200175]